MKGLVNVIAIVLVTALLAVASPVSAASKKRALKDRVVYACTMFLQRNYTSATQYDDLPLSDDVPPIFLKRQGNNLHAWQRYIKDPLLYEGAVYSKTVPNKDGVSTTYTLSSHPYKDIFFFYSDISRRGKLMQASQCVGLLRKSATKRL